MHSPADCNPTSRTCAKNYSEYNMLPRRSAIRCFRNSQTIRIIRDSHLTA
jgi:hypothetical protein